MRKFILRVAAVVSFGLFATASGAFASTHDGAKFVGQTVEPAESTESTDATESGKLPNNIVDKPSPAWTKEDCTKAWKMNMFGCNASPPNLRAACWAAASALFAACVASSQG